VQVGAATLHRTRRRAYVINVDQCYKSVFLIKKCFDWFADLIVSDLIQITYMLHSQDFPMTHTTRISKEFGEKVVGLNPDRVSGKALKASLCIDLKEFFVLKLKKERFWRIYILTGECF
jgi:hypothetical protein